MEIIRTNDKSRGTLILDLDTHRAIVYQVCRTWMLRIGSHQPGKIAPTDFCPDCFCGFVETYGTKKAAIAEAEYYLREFCHA